MREKLIESFEDTLKASDSYVLSMRTRQSMMLSEVYEEGFFSRTRSVDKNGKILILPMTTFQAARILQTKSGGECGTAVLNFANPVEPGGGVWRGAMAQEECLCRSSNLYPCLSQQKIRTGFYARHAGADQAQASDRVVYVPDVVVFKSDDRLPQILSVDDWIQVDVLTCAAPYYPALENRSDAILSELYKKRARNILECAVANRADILVLGAFGCGAFRNPPYLMAGAFCEAIKEGRYLESLSVIAFAIPEDGGQSTQNLQTFKNVFFQQRLWNEQIEGKAFGEGDKQNERELHLESHLVQKIGQNVQYGSRPAEADLEDKYDWSTSGGTIVLFPTSNHENLNIKPCGRYKGKLFSILGDSISTFENTVPDGYEVFYQGEMRQQSGVKSAKDTWWSQAVRMLGGRVLVDNAWSGSRAAPLPGAVQRFPSGCSSYRTSGLHLGSTMPDVIIVFLGFNDWANGVPLYPAKEREGVGAFFHRFLYGKKEAEKRRKIPPTFWEAYGAILSQLCSSYPAAEIWCCTLGASCMRDNTDWKFPELYAGIPLGHYNEAIRALARRFGAGVIDFAEYQGSIETVDGSHPTAEGMKQLAEQVVRTFMNSRCEGKENA